MEVPPLSILRVKPGTSAVVFLEDGTTVSVQADMAFDSDDPMVRAICKATGTKPDDWFQSDAAAEPPRKRITSARIETAAGLTR